MNDAPSWVPLQADGVTPSAEIAMADETITVRYGADGHSARATASAAATGHLLRRTLGAAIDLSSFPEVRLWLNASRRATGAPTEPFVLELRLGSAALPVDAAGNAWSRNLPVTDPGRWELVRLSLQDLPPAARSAVLTLQLRCLSAGPFSCTLDDLNAVRDEMVPDVEAALLARLHNLMSLGGSAVPAIVHSPDATPPNAPYFRLLRLSMEFSDARTQTTTTRSDFSPTGFLVRPPRFAYDLRYQLDVFATSAADEALMLDFALGQLPPRGDLVVNGIPLTLEMSSVPALEMLEGHRTDRLSLGYRVLATKEIGAVAAVRPVTSVNVNTDLKVA